MFCSDGLDPVDIKKFGHIDHCIRESIKLGLKPVDAICIASKNNFDYYNMGKDLGGIAPGKLADILIFDDLKSFKPQTSLCWWQTCNGSNGKFITVSIKKKPNISPWIKKTVNLKKFSPKDFIIKSKKPEVEANTIFMQTEIITKIGFKTCNLEMAKSWHLMDLDVWKVAAFDRTHGSKKRSIGFLENFGADIGAFASTWSFHENDI